MRAARRRPVGGRRSSKCRSDRPPSRAIGAALAALAGCCSIALLVLINVEVVARYLFARSTLIADEYGGYLMAWITLLGSGHRCAATAI